MSTMEHDKKQPSILAMYIHLLHVFLYDCKKHTEIKIFNNIFAL